MRTARGLFLYTRIPSVLRRMRQTCGAFLTICLRLTLGKFTYCRPKARDNNRRVFGTRLFFYRLWWLSWDCFSFSVYILAISASAMINVFGEMLSVLAISLIVWDVTDASFAKDTAWLDFAG